RCPWTPTLYHRARSEVRMELHIRCKRRAHSLRLSQVLTSRPPKPPPREIEHHTLMPCGHWTVVQSHRQIITPVTAWTFCPIQMGAGRLHAFGCRDWRTSMGAVRNGLGRCGPLLFEAGPPGICDSTLRPTILMGELAPRQTRLETL